MHNLDNLKIYPHCDIYRKRNYSGKKKQERKENRETKTTKATWQQDMSVQVETCQVRLLLQDLFGNFIPRRQQDKVPVLYYVDQCDVWMVLKYVNSNAPRHAMQVSLVLFESLKCLTWHRYAEVLLWIEADATVHFMFQLTVISDLFLLYCVLEDCFVSSNET